VTPEVSTSQELKPLEKRPPKILPQGKITTRGAPKGAPIWPPPGPGSPGLYTPWKSKSRKNPRGKSKMSQKEPGTRKRLNPSLGPRATKVPNNLKPEGKDQSKRAGP